MMEAELALRKLQKEVDKVIVVGFSMGGLIAMYLAKRYKIEKLVLLSAAAKYIYPTQILARYSRNSKRSMLGKLEENELFKLYKYKLKKTPITCDI